MFFPIKRALLSVSDKEGIVELAQILHNLGCELISTGGTAKALSDAGLPITDISKVTGNPEAFGGRMKTISFQIESALLFDRDRDAAEAAALNIQPIDLVVCNLYPFAKVLQQGADFDTLVENIDIGGPTMIRAAAKNFKYVAVVTQPTDYAALIQQLNENQGSLSIAFRQQLMAKAFNHTADYDALIATTMSQSVGQNALRLSFEQGETLRYGENSHQKATFYRQTGAKVSLFDLEILHGKQLSFNNILDINGAIQSVRQQNLPTCAIIKHNNPCGLASGINQAAALEWAWAGDPISAFGSIIAFNTTLELSTVEFFALDNADRSKRKFIEVVVAPHITPQALAYLQHHKDLRVVLFNPNSLPATLPDYRFLNGSLLAQDADTVLFDKLDLVTATPFEVTAHKDLIAFGIHAICQIKSNSIVIVRRHNGYLQLLGMGAGQPNRLVSTRLAIDKCRENLQNEYHGTDFEAYFMEQMQQCILISDAFFPFADNVELAAASGIRCIVQPGGSIRDKSVIECCNTLGVAMVFSGTRHFKH